MNNQKLENQLNLALDATEKEREQSLDLSVGFDAQTDRWELIVKYSGSLTRLKEELNITVTELLNEYAILIIPQPQISLLANYPEVEFVEKPKSLALEQRRGIIDSCIQAVQRPELNLKGSGVIVGIVDSGIDYFHPDFRNPNGTTRIKALWDQTIGGNPPEDYSLGSLYLEETINQALEAPTRSAGLAIVPSVDISGHGTHVAGIACGNQGVAPESEILIVKLDKTTPRSFPRTTQLMLAVDYLVRYGVSRSKPIAINISFGNNYGGHDSSSLLETYLNDISNLGKTSIVCGTGNEGVSGRHQNGKLANSQTRIVEYSISEYEPTMNLQIWKSYVDQFDITIIHPNNTRIGPLIQQPGAQRFRLGNTSLLLYFGEPAPYNRDQEIYIEMLPINTYIDDGLWKIELSPRKIVIGRYDMWLPVAESTGTLSRFLNQSEDTTLTIPSTASKVISVGAYDSLIDSFAYFSGRGFTRTGAIKPDLVAPGVNIESAAPGGGTSTRSGTSMATPYVTGSAALLMQWGIVNRNDPFLYGEKLKAYLTAGTRKLPIELQYPNPRLGYGPLCLRSSIPEGL